MPDFLDFSYYIRKYLKIITKSGDLENLKPNRYQLEIIRIIEECERNKRPIRIIVLKCRQVGISTLMAAYLYFKSGTNFFRKSMIIADDQDNSANLFSMCKRFFDHSPDAVRPMRKYSNEKKIEFDNPKEEGERGLQSVITVETARKLTAGRSSTIHYLHMSEFAFWKKASIVVSGLFQSVPLNNPDTAIIIESTANGMDGDGAEFYKRWEKAYTGQSDFIPVFFPWFWNDEYEIHNSAHMDLTDYEHESYDNEIKILETYLKDYPYNQAVAKLRWRRYKIDNDMGSDKLNPLEQFRQEYPASPEEAFITSGHGVFNKAKILRQIKHLKDNPQPIESPTIEFSEELLNNLTLYELPDSEKGYAIGADIAEGLVEGDYSSLFVIDNNSNQVAEWHGHIDPDLFGEILCELGKYFNYALLAPEVNNMGIATLATIKRKQYHNVYTRTVKEERADTYTKKLGWQTNSSSKRKMIGALLGAHRENLINIRSEHLLREMGTVIREEDGSVNLNGKDRTVACCIAYQCLDQICNEKHTAYIPSRTIKKVDPNKGMSIEDSIRMARGGDSYYD